MISFVCACFWINQLNLLSDYLLELVDFLFLFSLLWTLFTITKRLLEYMCANVRASQRNTQPSAIPASFNINATTMDTFEYIPEKSDESEISDEWIKTIRFLIDMNVSPVDVISCVHKAKDKNAITKIIDLQNVLPKSEVEIIININFINVAENSEITTKFKHNINSYRNVKELEKANELTMIRDNGNQRKITELQNVDCWSDIEKPIDSELQMKNPTLSGFDSNEQTKSGLLELDYLSTKGPDTTQSLKDFIQSFNDKSISKIPSGEYNILLLGETGTGKSTTINAFASYLKYVSFDEALSGEFTSLIPPETSQIKGESCTQSPVGYVFKTANGQTIRIIDTPGMGDTRGTEVDRENFDQILHFVYHFENLHGICILMHSNETRKNSAIRYCIPELLARLHKSVCKNIFFCFTFARPSDFGAGDGYDILQTLLNDDLHETGLELRRGKNCFFIDNEAYRFLLARDREIPCTEEEKEKYEESWNKSSQNTNAMIDAVKELEAHDIEQTRLLNHAQKLMMLLAEPLVLVMQNLYTNKQKFEFQLNLMNGPNKPYFIDVNKTCLQLNPLYVPKTVCSESRCVKIADHRSKNQSCHNLCNEINAKNRIIGSTELKYCTSMSKDGSCTKCGCQWRKHMRLTDEFKQETISIIKGYVDMDSYNRKAKTSSIEYISSSNIIDNLSSHLEINRQQLEKIENVSAILGYIAQIHSNTSLNKFIEPVLDKLIEIEKSKKSEQISNCQLYLQMKVDYQKRVQNIAEFSGQDVKLENIINYCENLADIEPLGQVLQNFQSDSEKEFVEFQLRDNVVETDN